MAMNQSMQFSMLIEQEAKGIVQTNKELKKQNLRLFNDCEAKEKQLKNFRAERFKDIFKLSHKIVLLDDQLDSTQQIKDQSKKLMQELAVEKNNKTDLQNKIHNLESTLTQKNSQNEQLKQENQTYILQIKELQQKLQKAEANSGQTHRQSIQYQSKLQQLQIQLKQLRIEHNKTKEELEIQKRLYTGLQEERVKEAKILNQKLMETSSQSMSVSQQLLQCNKTIEQLNQESKRLSDEIVEYRNQDRALKGTLQAINEELKQMTLKNTQLKHDNEKLHKDNQKLRQLNRECFTTIEKLRNKKIFKEEPSKTVPKE